MEKVRLVPGLAFSLQAHRSRASMRSAMYLRPCRQKNDGP